MSDKHLTKSDAGAGLGLYFIILALLSAVGYWAWIDLNQHLILVFVPATASVATRLIRREGFSDVSFGFGQGFGRAALASILLPLLICVIAYGVAWQFDLVGFHPAKLPAPFPNLENPLRHFVWTVFLASTVVVAFFVPLAAGEEIGWRGYMLTRLIASGAPMPITVSGLIWAGWHLPLIILASYGPGSGPALPAAAVFTVTATVFAAFLARLRLATGSVWPPILAHSAWNALTQAAFNPAVKGGLWPWLGETGVLLGRSTILVVALTLRFVRLGEPKSAF